MSAPIDIPQNINLHLAHTERVVQTPKPETQDNSSYQFAFELQNKPHGNEGRGEITEKKRRKKERDSYEGHASAQRGEEDSNQQSDGAVPEALGFSEEPKVLAVGKILDVTA